MINNVSMEDLLLGGVFWTSWGAWCALPLLVFVWIFESVFRRRIAARYHCFLWMLVAVRMMLPVTFESPLSLNGGLSRATSFVHDWATSETIMSEAGVGLVEEDPYDVFTFDDGNGNQRTVHRARVPSETLAEIESIDYEVALQDLPAIGDEPVAYEASAYEAKPPVAAAVPSIGWDELGWEELLTYGIGATWLVVTLGLLFSAAAQSLRFRRRLRRSDEVTAQEVVDQVLRVCDVLRVGRRPKVKEVADLTVPAVFGIWRPTICLPVGAIDSLTSEQLRLILMHEVAHVKRRDGLVATVASTIRALHWHNPLAWFVFGRIRENMEQAADDMALRRAENDSQSIYGRLLLQYASESCSHAIGLMFPSKGRPLARRIKMLDANSKQNHWGARLVATMAVIAIAMSGLSNEATPVPVPRAPQTINIPKFEMSASPTKSFIPDDEVYLARYDLTAALEKVSETQPNEDADQVLRNMFESGQIVDGQLVMTANADAHAQAAQAIEALEESGYWEIMYIVRFIAADIDTARSLQADWSTSNVKPLFDGTLTNYVDPKANSESNDENSADPTMVLNSMGSSINPLIWTRLDEPQVREFVIACQEDHESSVLFAPKVTLLNGQSGRICDESQRPFVTGLKTIRVGDVSELEPIIHVATEGTRLFLRGNVNAEGNLDIEWVLTLSSIGDVSHANLPIGVEKDDGMLATVQVPETFVSSVEAIGTMKPDQSLLIVSPTPYAKEAPDKEATAMCFMVTPMWSRGE